MSLFVLDTDTLTLFQLGHAAIRRRVNGLASAEVAIAVITIEEQLGGWYTKLRRTKKPDELTRVYERLADNIRSLSRMQILSFTESAIHRRNDFKRQKLNVGIKDLGIAAIALEHNAVLVTRNRQDFRRTPGLRIEDWSQ